MADAGKREPREFELKLEFDPADMTSLKAHPLLAASEHEKRTLISVYFDTDDLALQKARVALRVRDTGQGYLQTIKGMNGTAELFDRPEWEQEIGGRQPDLSLAAGTPLEPLLQGRGPEALRPLFQTRIERDIHRVTCNGSEIEVALDRGEIEAAQRWSPVHEVELELKEGDPAELFRLARSLADRVPLRLAVKSKAERGYELAGGIAEGAEKAGLLQLDGGMICQQAFRAIGENCLRQIIANERAMCAGDADGLHQMRIGLRRLRAAIAAFAKLVVDSEVDGIKGELKWITNELGPARDLDVFEADVLAPMHAERSEDPNFAETRRVFVESRAKAYAVAIGSVRSDRFRNALLDVAGWIEAGPWTVDASLRARRERPVSEHAAKILARFRKRIRERGADLHKLKPEERHKLRIQAKNLRYAVEFFADVFPDGKNAKRRDAALSALKELQDALGALNDMAQREALIANGRDFENRALLAPQWTEEEKLLERAQEIHARFAKVKSFWK